MQLEAFIKQLPKVELHVHLEGTLEPELMFELAKRNNIKLPYASVEEVKQAYQFTDLQSFLDIYYQSAQVLCTEQDFFDLAMAYYQRCHEQGIVHTEVFFDPQTHLPRGVAIETLFAGLSRAKQVAAQQLGVSVEYILCFLRHLSEEDAIDCMEQALPHGEHFIGVGLDSSESGNPPEKFARVFAMAREQGFKCVAHAGEEGPAEYIKTALDMLKVERIDHGVRCIDDSKVLAELVAKQVPLTVCPLSNVALKVVDKLEDHPLPQMIEQGLLVTINSDDPAYFGGQLEQNLTACARAFGWDKQMLAKLSINAVISSWARLEQKILYIQQINRLLTI
ncbi:adenosine deaminase [Aliagarivorans taiwanensis]|uniref:adenosine deaminase n=1 Tax=Aliagarivorans taiwanensis TaxID=561966 RepID=UPI000426A4E8|nr:adenosine deaminase [Aliagarivorans taiwanensis]